MANVTREKSHQKLVGIILFIVLILTLWVLYLDVFRPELKSKIKIEGVYLPKAVEIKKFALTDHHGKLFNNENLKNHWTLLFFGFTNCGFVCPTTLAELNKMYHLLKNQLPPNLMPQIVFISVDPERDTVKRMNEYVTAFNPKFIGLRGNESETAQLESDLHILAAKTQVNQPGRNNYTIDHTAEILLINPKGQLQAYMSYPHKAEQMAKDYKLMVLF
ncbi:MAG: Electron transport protein SCO1/SenC [Gammaproteobacteria bacterium]|nr:Electron transport protein SCO1/SenC [Gammaproteobacteria bacterium]